MDQFTQQFLDVFTPLLHSITEEQSKRAKIGRLCDLTIAMMHHYPNLPVNESFGNAIDLYSQIESEVSHG